MRSTGNSFLALLSKDEYFKLMLVVASSLWVFTSLVKIPLMVPNFYSDVGYLWIRDVYQGHHNLRYHTFSMNLNIRR